MSQINQEMDVVGSNVPAPGWKHVSLDASAPLILQSILNPSQA